MTDHGWPDHHDDPGYHDPYDEHVPTDDHTPFEQPDYVEIHHDDAPPDVHDAPDVHDVAYEHHPDATDQHLPDVTDTHHPTSTAEPDTDPDTVFPPAVDVGPLPEPVDGFPWIDTGSLGVVDPAAIPAAVDPVDPHELAEYAAADLPPGVDPWATLADSDDPATAALARWWSQNQQ